MLEITPDAFDGVRFRGVGRQTLEHDAATLGLHMGAHELRAVGLQTVPDDQQLRYWRFYFRLFNGSIKSPQIVEFLKALQTTIGKLIPAITDSCFQLKRYCSTGVSPFGAQVLARQGLSDRPDSSDASLHRHALREIPRLIDVGALEDGDVVGEKLQRDGVDGRSLEVGDVFRHLDDGDAVARTDA